MNNITDLLNSIPSQYVKYSLLAIPMITRAYYALRNDGGLVGVWKSIMFGVSTEKKDA